MTVIKEVIEKKQEDKLKIGGKEMNKLRDYLLENYVDKDGDLIMIGLDFGDFDGNVYIGSMKVKGNLIQNYQTVEGDLFQDDQKVRGDLFQHSQEVEGDLWQDEQKVEGNLVQDEKKTKELLKWKGI